MFYFGKQHESAAIGGRIVHVTCDNCDCSFIYELVRMGEGSANSHYGMGSSSATQAAKIRSQQNLEQRLTLEAELVPCPKCNWINEELVRGFRQSQYRKMGILALLIGVVGTVGSLLCALYNHLGTIPDRAAQPYFLYVSPAIFISIAIALLLTRRWLRSRIDPNRNFPLAPQVPVGTPPAMITDPESGEIQPAFPDKNDNANIVGNWVDFQVGRHDFPLVCCDCLNSTAPEQPFKLYFYKEIEIAIPRCKECVQKSRRSYRQICGVTSLIVMLVSCIPLFMIKIDPVWFWFLIVAFPVISFGVGCTLAGMRNDPAYLSSKDYSRALSQSQILRDLSRPSIAPRPITELMVVRTMNRSPNSSFRFDST